MNRFGFTLLAATALTLGMGGAALAQDSTEPDCPEDFDTEPGCDLSLPDKSDSESQPVEGAATAPVEATDGGDGTTTMTGADTEGDGGKPEADGSGSDASSGSDTGSTGENAATGGAETGGAETAPTPEAGDGGEDSNTMTGADQDGSGGDAESSGDATSGSEEQSDASGGGDQESSDQPVDEAEVEGHPNLDVAYDENGRYYTEDDVPTFNVAEDGTVDWMTYSGFRRYHSECHVCHGPDGEGSTYAPAIKNSAVRMDYYDFYDVVVNGRKNGNNVMPSFGDNANVMCYLDDIYVYLKARGAGAVARGRPPKKEPKSDAIQEAENACMGG